VAFRDARTPQGLRSKEGHPMQHSSAAPPRVRARFVAGVVGLAAVAALAIPVFAGPAAAASLRSGKPGTQVAPAPVTSTTIPSATAPDPAPVVKPGPVPNGRRW
jgi:hypothetical protein